MEDTSNPVWIKRSKKLQAWLREVGPRTTKEIHRGWQQTQGWTPGLVTNLIAYADGIYIQHVKDKWWAVPVSAEDFSREMARRPAPTPEECPGESVSAEAADQGQSVAHPTQVEDGLADMPHPPEDST